MNEKLHKFAPIFASMLVARAFETDGNVIDCETVMNDSNKYRNGQDHIAAFINEKIKRSTNTNQSVKKKSLVEEFKIWFQDAQISRKPPKSEEIYECMNKKFKMQPHSSLGWIGLEIIRNDMAEDPINQL